ncbi:MAG TPA: outer membrane beta-barrel protein [Dinghuibacter sp.]|uniref:outer membrane beta-barrel protein n=1 Tax=Dinghuibacter sp. TaxID=2024697 RepID=UPI002BBB768E|nr:outer membrane beta-barrel protein [Dinghuibacter sp.]HTJ14871.1 outer membrane beta-barrel protein [Dinghuibacter sp.]
MRYVLLLLIFCITFGVLDSVPRYRGNAPSIGSVAAPAAPDAHRASDARSYIHSAALIVHHSTPAVHFHKRHSISQFVALHRPAVRPGASSARPVAPAAPDTALAVPSYHAAMEDIVHGTVEPGEALDPHQMMDEASMDDMGAPDVDRLSPVAIAMAQASGDLETPDGPSPESLADFARLAKDMTGMPILRDSIRNSLMDAHGLQFGGIAGLNWSGASAANASGKVSGRPLTGVSLGIFADVPVNKHLSIRPKVVYEYQGYRPNVDGQPVNLHVAYLHIAPDFVYHTDWVNRRFFVGAGPYLAYALNGTYNLKGIDNDMSFGAGAGANLRRTDAGLGMTAGLLMDRNFVLGAQMDLGLRNIAPEGPARIHTRSVGLSLMYVFRNRQLF